MATVTDSTQSTTNQTALQAMLNGSSAASGSSTSSAADNQDRFLKLLVAQMKNQDPMNPMDNAQVTSQLAQISTVQGIEQLNSTMSRFTEANSNSRAVDSANLIGQTVLSESMTITRTAGQTGSSRAGVDLDSAADKVKVELIDAGGSTVAAVDFTNQPAGTLSFEWSGTDGDGRALAAGTYTMRVTASNGKDAVSARTLATSVVTGITQGSDGVKLALASGTSVGRDDIKGVFRP